MSNGSRSALSPSPNARLTLVTLGAASLRAEVAPNTEREPDAPAASAPDASAPVTLFDLGKPLALITYLATLVPDMAPELKIAVVEGAVTGGGLTVIANAPNPAGQALLSRFFDGAINPFSLFAAALLPTLIAAAAFRML